MKTTRVIKKLNELNLEEMRKIYGGAKYKYVIIDGVLRIVKI